VQSKFSFHKGKFTKQTIFFGVWNPVENGSKNMEFSRESESDNVSKIKIMDLIPKLGAMKRVRYKKAEYI
jgi:hypothetical protein